MKDYPSVYQLRFHLMTKLRKNKAKNTNKNKGNFNSIRSESTYYRHCAFAIKRLNGDKHTELS